MNGLRGVKPELPVECWECRYILRDDKGKFTCTLKRKLTAETSTCKRGRLGTAYRPHMTIFLGIQFDVYCGVCGQHLCGLTEVHKHHNGEPYITVKPCPRCVKNAKGAKTK